MKQKTILRLLGGLAAGMLLLILSAYTLTLSVAAVEPKQTVHPTSNVALGFSWGQVTSTTTFLFPDRLPVDSGGGNVEPPRDELTEEESQQIQLAIERNIRRLEAEGKLPRATIMAVPLAWPLRPSDRLADYGYHRQSGFVDHNLAYPDQVLDYNCGDRTYDLENGYNHRGTDLGLWPFGWNKMDNDQVQVVAAAPGIIVGRTDGNYDRNCSGTTNAPWNSVHVRHSDGSVAWYGHLKNGSLTGKRVGDTVQAGEYLGIVGSSGRSGGPHLHFQLQDSAGQVIDPYQGTCNTLTPNSWWITQPPYYDSAINSVTTGDARVEFTSCPSQTITHIADDFNPGDTIYFTAYYRDLLAGQVSEYTIYRPDDSVYQRWTRSTSYPHSTSSYWWWSYRIDPGSITGTWRLEVDFESQTYQTFFNVGDSTYITVTSPAADTSWVPGLTHTIRWEDNLGGNVRLDLYRYGSYLFTIAKSIPSNGIYSWAVPSSISIGASYQVRVVDLANDAFYADSDFFTIGDPAEIFVEKTYLPIVAKEYHEE
jgi:murein DD-endopeptidase MepM/ murein hydrolase activator NlpD